MSDAEQRKNSPVIPSGAPEGRPSTALRMNSVEGRTRIAAAFANAKEARRGALIPYLCAGDPDATTSAALLAAAAAHGDIVELGIPYGDPLADGPTVAAAAQRSLANGTTIDDVLALIAHSRTTTPIVAFTYFNPVLQYGVERFADALVDAGACGAIVPDIPLEESHRLIAAFEPRGLALPLLVAPTTPPDRARAIASASTGFTYIVSRLGVTSAGKGPDFDWIAGRVADLRAVTAVPLAIGFGLSTADHVREAWRIADGAIVGSALIDSYASHPAADAAACAEAFLASLT